MAGLQRALDDLAAGRIIIISGDKLRGGDIDFAIAASRITPDAINFMAIHGRGLICLTMTASRALRLGISLVQLDAERSSGRQFGRSIEARHGVSTGISAADRAQTVRVASHEDAVADDLSSPGHIFPLIAADGGVVARPGATEASIELCRLAGVGDAAVICSIMRDDGEMARIDDVQGLAATFNLAVANMDELIATLQPALAAGQRWPRRNQD